MVPAGEAAAAEAGPEKSAETGLYRGRMDGGLPAVDSRRGLSVSKPQNAR
jgi:hypothetical protein